MKLTIILILLSPMSLFATPKITQIYDGEFNMDGPACWLENSKSEVILYDDLQKAKIKIDSKITSLNRSSGKFTSAFYACGNSYEYQSEDKNTLVSIKMNSSKTKKCTGTVIVKTPKGTTTLNQMTSNCGQ